MGATRVKDHLADWATGVAGAAAGTVVDPKTGLSKARAGATTPRVLLLLAAVTAGYLAGRWFRRRGNASPWGSGS
ncbi:hypothetical protein GCM10022251_22770 [Phytohabitans flavus]|uniref:Uncharacterized protein n=1 Tax=Phytohabitans flavus TaxID=1076124 RepID=A0A6F8XS18_9ACTN|nr:hypothetical protein [Phytohabitans flavus]BCB76541.1 hypothetical protein Pflav_029510 [Phytohabitans flavus]